MGDVRGCASVQVSLPGHICAVVVTTMVLEGWSNKLDPDHSVLCTVQVSRPNAVRPKWPKCARLHSYHSQLHMHSVPCAHPPAWSRRQCAPHYVMVHWLCVARAEHV